MKRIVFSIGALPFACLAGEIYNYCLTEPLCRPENGFPFNYSWFLWIAFGLVAFGLFLDFLPASKFMTDVPTGLPQFSTSRKEADADLEQLYKDMTGRYTPEERCAMEQAERKNHNVNMRSAAFWGGGDRYTDADGNVRDLNDQIIYVRR